MTVYTAGNETVTASPGPLGPSPSGRAMSVGDLPCDDRHPQAAAGRERARVDGRIDQTPAVTFVGGGMPGPLSTTRRTGPVCVNCQGSATVRSTRLPSAGV